MKPGNQYPYLFSLIALCGMCSIFYALLRTYTGCHWPSVWLLAISLAMFILSAYDKAISGTSSTRVPEKILFFGALIGGAAGLLLAMKLFRHKIRKASFQFLLAVIIVVQVLLWHYFLN